jgi:short-subunit dehydrogenase
MMAKAALVTGASAGLGAELAQLFAADGHDLVLVARRRDRLEELSRRLQQLRGSRVDVIPEDLADPGAPARLAAELETRGIEVEFLVNNAGFGMTGRFAELDLARQLAMVQVNIAAVVHLTRLVLPAMIARKSGRILNIGSMAGFLPGPSMAMYYASKAFVNSFTEALHFELRETGVTVTLSCPGPTDTEFAQVARNGKTRLFKMRSMSASEVAAHAYRAMMRGKPIAIPGVRNKLGAQSLRVVPRAMLLRTSAALNRVEE